MNIISKRINTSLPPSSAGTGNKLKMPKFILINAINGNRFCKLCFAAFAITTVTPTGPETALKPYLPLIKSIKLRQITAQYEAVVLNMFTRYLSCGLAVSYDGNLVFAFGAIETDLFASFGCVTYAFNITKFMINLSLAIGLYILNAYLFAKKLDIE